MSRESRSVRGRHGGISRFLGFLLSISFVLGIVSIDHQEAVGCHDHEPLQTSASCDACWISATHNGSAPPGYVKLAAPDLLAWIPLPSADERCASSVSHSAIRLRAPPSV